MRPAFFLCTRFALTFRQLDCWRGSCLRRRGRGQLWPVLEMNEALKVKTGAQKRFHEGSVEPGVLMGLQPTQGDEKCLGPATTVDGTVALSFVIPSEAEGSAVLRTLHGNALSGQDLCGLPGLVSLLFAHDLKIFKLLVQDRILFPILIIEVPPLRRVDRESLLLHGFLQECAASAFLWRTAGIVRIGAFGHLIISAGHLHFCAGFQIVERKVDSASAVVSGPFRGVGDENLLVIRCRIPKDFRYVPGTVAVMNDKAISLCVKLAIGADE